MAKRYQATSSFSLGRGKVFVTNYKQRDGSQGYTEDQVSGLSKKQIRDHFDIVDVSGAKIVEQATAEPGEVRAVSRSCDECGFEAASMAGLAAHKRSHGE